MSKKENSTKDFFNGLTILIIIMLVFFGTWILKTYEVKQIQDKYNSAMSTTAELKCPMMQYESEKIFKEKINVACWNRVYDEYGLVIEGEFTWMNSTLDYLVIPIWENCNGQKNCSIFDYTKEYSIDGHKFKGQNCILSCDKGIIKTTQGVNDAYGFTVYECQQEPIHHNFTTGRYLPEENMIECFDFEDNVIWGTCYKCGENECCKCKGGDYPRTTINCALVEGYYKSQTFTLEELRI